MAAIVAHDFVTGDHSSAGPMAPSRPTASVVSPPPVTRTCPSGKSVRLWYARGKAIGAVSCQDRGAGLVMSRTYVVSADGTTGTSESKFVPLFMIWPGRYMTALPPATATGSTIDHVCVARSRTRLTMVSSVVLAARTLPSGRTNMWG